MYSLGVLAMRTLGVQLGVGGGGGEGGRGREGGGESSQSLVPKQGSFYHLSYKPCVIISLVYK